MTRSMVAVWSVVALLATALGASAWPLNEDWGYAAYRQAPCDKCVPGVRPAMSTSYWIVTPTIMERHAQKPWLTIRVNGRETDLGKIAVVLDKELMLPVMVADQFGITPTRSGLNHQLMTLAGGRYLVKLRIGSRHAEIGYAERCLPVCPKWYNGKVYMPLESLGKLLDWEFSFNKLTGVLSIRTRGADVVSHRNAAGWAHARRMYDEAIGEYAAASNLDPGDWFLHRRLGDAYAGRGQLNDTLAAAHRAIGEALEKVGMYKELTEKNPGSAAAQYRNAVETAVARVNAYKKLDPQLYTLTDRLQPDAALDLYDRTLLVDPGYARVAKVASTTLILEDDLTAAESQTKRSAGACEDRAKQDYEAALKQYDIAIQAAPASVSLHKLLAEGSYKNNDPRKAVEEFQKALLIDPADGAARLELAQSLLSEGDFAGAAQEALNVLKVSPKSAAAYNVLGYALRKQGKNDEAIEAYKQAIELDKRFAIAYNNLGVALLGKQEFEDAAEVLARAVQLAPNHPDFYANYGLALFDTAQVGKAESAWRSAVALAPDSAEYHADLAMALQRMGNMDAAIGEANAALQSYDKNTQTLDDLGRKGAAGGADMQSDGRKVLDAARLSAECTLTWALLEKGRIAEALAAAKDAEKLSAQDPSVQASLAAVQVERLDANAAATAIDVALAAEPDNLLCQAIGAASKAMIPDQAEAAGKLVDAAMAKAENTSDRWTWYFLGRACAALGRTAEASEAYSHPQPDKQSVVRHQQIADYLARHPRQKGLRARPRVVVEPPPTAVETQPVVAEPQGALLGELTSAAGAGDQPTLKIVNKSGKFLDVVLDTPQGKTLWTVLPSTIRKAGALDRGAGAYEVTIIARGAGLKPFKQSIEFQTGRAYTLTLTLP